VSAICYKPLLQSNKSAAGQLIGHNMGELQDTTIYLVPELCLVHPLPRSAYLGARWVMHCTLIFKRR
jgi:hypothetical protein